MQGDACNLPSDLGHFGCILAANLIDRLHTPSDFLDRLPGLVAPNGIVVLTSPYTWLEQFTEKVCAEKIEPRHDKTSKVTVRPAKTQISLRIHPI